MSFIQKTTNKIIFISLLYFQKTGLTIYSEIFKEFKKLSVLLKFLIEIIL